MKLKNRGSFLFSFLQKPVYEICLVRIKKQVGEKGSTVSLFICKEIKHWEQILLILSIYYLVLLIILCYMYRSRSCKMKNHQFRGTLTKLYTTSIISNSFISFFSITPLQNIAPRLHSNALLPSTWCSCIFTLLYTPLFS